MKITKKLICRKYLFLPFLLLIISLTVCTNKNLVKKNHKKENLLTEYSKEGFISDNLFRVIIVKPSDSKLTTIKIKDLASKRAFSSFQKYILSNYDSLKRNSQATLLNLIHDKGILFNIKDEKKSRIIYVFEIKKSGLLKLINSLGR